MLITTKKLLLGILFILGLASCQKEETKFSLPPKTEDGRNTLGFVTNGNVWVNYGDICNWGKCDDNVVTGRLHTYADGTRAVVIEAYHNDKKKSIFQNLTITAININGTGTYLLNTEEKEIMSLTTDWSTNTFYNNLEDSNAKLTISRLDTVHQIISGEFSGTLYKYKDTATTIDISDGRFDTKLTYSHD